ncbi:MAG: hypothetical protein V1664_05090 [Candidatus Uhrbacteria bacterium]
MYPHHCRQKSKSFFCRPIFSFILLGIAALILFLAGLYHLRSDEWKKGEEETTEVLSGSISNLIPSENLSREATIKSLSSGQEIGLATRGLDKGVFYHTVKINLPAIDREKEFYEGWLLRQAPYDFFSTGEMITNEVGEFVLEWTDTHDDLDDYNQVVITREARDGNSVPGARVAEGRFE